MARSPSRRFRRAAVTAHNPRPKSAIDLTALEAVNQLLVSPQAYDI